MSASTQQGSGVTGRIDWSKKRCVVLDMDGTIYLGNNPIPEAVEGIRRNADNLDFIYLSNNTSHSPLSYVTKLAGMGLEADLERILSPTTPLVLHLERHNLTRGYIVGNADFRADLARRMPGFVHTEEGAQCVILAYDTQLTYEKLARSALLLQKGLPFLVTHPDLVCPSPEGPLPDVGSFLALYKTATGRVPDKIFGKPDPAILAPVFEKYDPSEVVMAGDRLSTDKKLAENAGIDFILVLSGEATPEDARKEEKAPTVMAPTLGHALP